VSTNAGVLQYAPLQKHIWGGKGVGSQGDGTAQFLCKDETAQGTVCDILEGEMQLHCLRLTVPPSHGHQVRMQRAPGLILRVDRNPSVALVAGSDQSPSSPSVNYAACHTAPQSSTLSLSLSHTSAQPHAQVLLKSSISALDVQAHGGLGRGGEGAATAVLTLEEALD
jgi:hypothetical protein